MRGAVDVEAQGEASWPTTTTRHSRAGFFVQSKSPMKSWKPAKLVPQRKEAVDDAPQPFLLLESLPLSSFGGGVDAASSCSSDDAESTSQRGAQKFRSARADTEVPKSLRLQHIALFVPAHLQQSPCPSQQHRPPPAPPPPVRLIEGRDEPDEALRARFAAREA